MDAARQPMDLVAVRYFATTASYTSGQLVAWNGKIYRAVAVVAPGPFDTADWQEIAVQSSVSDTPPAEPTSGQFWVNAANGNLYAWWEDPNSAAWVQVNMGPPSASTPLSAFGVIGDGVADDTTALQAWLDAPGKTKVAVDGVYAISRGLVSSEPNRVIRIETLKVTAADQKALTVTGDGCKVTARVDGQSKCWLGVEITGGGCEVSGCDIFDMHHTTLSAFGIRAITPNGVNIHDNRIKRLTATSNAVLGDGFGMCRAIQLWGGDGIQHALKPSRIASNFIEDVHGEEGDAIGILFTDMVSVPFGTAKLHIVDNVIHNSHRRAIKVQASDVIVRGNRITNDLASPTNPSNHIDSIVSDNVTIEGNDIRWNTSGGAYNGIHIGEASGGVTPKNNIVRDNAVFANTTGFCIWPNEVTLSRITGNTLSGGGQGIGMTVATKMIIEGNTFLDGPTGTGASYDINLVGNNSEIIVSNNVALSGLRTNMIYSAAPDSVIENNHARRTTGQMVGIYVTAARTIYTNNSTKSDLYSMQGDYTGQFPYGFRNTGSGDNQHSGWFGVNDTPSAVTHPGQKFFRGDIAYRNQPVAGGAWGWVCTSDGTPGTWYPMTAVGTLDLIVSATGPALASAVNAINTTEKRTGKLCHDATTNKIMRATGTAATSTWVSVDGATTITPV